MDIKPFKSELKSRVKLKKVPNKEFNESTGEFSFGDYVWKEPDEQLYPTDRDPADVAEEDMYEPYRDVFGSVDEIRLEERESGDAYWADVTVSLPQSASEQRQLAHIVARGLQNRGTH